MFIVWIHADSKTTFVIFKLKICFVSLYWIIGLLPTNNAPLSIMNTWQYPAVAEVIYPWACTLDIVSIIGHQTNGRLDICYSVLNYNATPVFQEFWIDFELRVNRGFWFQDIMSHTHFFSPAGWMVLSCNMWIGLAFHIREGCTNENPEKCQIIRFVKICVNLGQIPHFFIRMFLL